MNEQLLSIVTFDTDDGNEITITGEAPLATGKTLGSESFGGQLEEENYKCRALNKLDKDTELCADQNGSQKKQKD